MSLTDHCSRQSILRSRRCRARPRPTAWTATSSWSTRCGPPTRCEPASSTSTARTRTPSSAPVATLTLQPTSTWRGHRAGQYVQVGVELPGSRQRLTRCFSISSAASLPGERFTLTIRAHDEGQVIKFLVNDARARPDAAPEPGRGRVHAPRERRDADQQPPACSSPAAPGITPAMSMIRTLLRDGYDGRANRKVTFLHFARSPEDQIFAEELAAIADGDNHIDVHLRYGDQIFSEFELRRLVPDFREHRHLGLRPRRPGRAGPGGVRRTRDRLRVEFFKPPRVSTGAAEGDVAFTRSGQTAANTGATPARAGRGPRAQARVRLPDGHLLLLRDDQDRRHRPQRPDRRGVLPARRRNPHLCQRPRGRLLRRPLT